MKKIILMLAIIANSIHAQPPNNSVITNSNDVLLKFNVFLDKTKKEMNTILISADKEKNYVKMTDSFHTFLVPNREYFFIVKYPGYNKNFIKVIPHNDGKLIECEVYLEKDKPDKDIGTIKYDNKSKKYIIYKT